jgi:C-terminal processing protease CtpA/Prc
MTDARAISHAESVMGYVADLRLATIVGGNTAGTNGDVASFAVPSGLRIHFSGLRVTGHDGQTPFHLVGVKPDVPVAPTIAGLRRGRDEVLERAIAVIDEPRRQVPPGRMR